jgi:hypothetical protein
MVPFLFPRAFRGRIADALVEDCVQDSIEAVANLMKVFERELAFIELPIPEDSTDDLLRQPLDSRWGRIG